MDGRWRVSKQLCFSDVTRLISKPGEQSRVQPLKGKDNDQGNLAGDNPYNYFFIYPPQAINERRDHLVIYNSSTENLAEHPLLQCHRDMLCSNPITPCYYGPIMWMPMMRGSKDGVSRVWRHPSATPTSPRSHHGFAKKAPLRD